MRVTYIFISNDSDTEVGIARNKRFSADPEELFDIEYERKDRVFPWADYYVYEVKRITSKPMFLGEKVPLINWDLKKYSLTMEIKMEEVDLDETISISETYSSQFAANFSLEFPSEKVGLRFGADASISKSKSVAVTYTKESYQLVSDNINFGDDIIVFKSTEALLGYHGYRTREYSLGICTISVEPVKLQGF